MKTFFIILIAIIFFTSCSDSENKHEKSVDEKKHVKHTGNNQDSIIAINQTLDNVKQSDIDKLKDLTKEQQLAWVYPIPENQRFNIETTFKYFKLISVQNKTKLYSSYIIMLIEDVNEDFVLQQQILVTVDNKGNYIASIPVSYLKNQTNSSIEYDTINGLYQFSLTANSYFIGDTIKVFQTIDVSKTIEPENDDIKQALYLSEYLITEYGTLKLIKPPYIIKD